MPEPSVESVIKLYMQLRDAKKGFEADAAKAKEKMDKLEAWLQQRAGVDGVNGYNTDYGTAYLSTTDYAKVKNWEHFVEFVMRTEGRKFLYKQVNKTAVKEFLEEFKTLPPGIEYGSKISMHVRKPGEKE